MKAYQPIDYDKQLEADEQEGFFLLREPAHLIKPGIEEEKKEVKSNEHEIGEGDRLAQS